MGFEKVSGLLKVVPLSISIVVIVTQNIKKIFFNLNLFILIGG